MSRFAILSQLNSTPSTLTSNEAIRPQQQRNRHRQNRTIAGHAAVYLLCFTGLVLLGTVLVLASVQAYFGVNWSDQIDEHDVIARNQEVGTAPQQFGNVMIGNVTLQDERVPRILHQVWMGLNPLPQQWARLSSECREMHNDYDYMLWSDDNSRQLIADEYNWFLPTYDGYQHYIQRVDAIRYFVLHKHGGIYFDFDIGCQKRLDPLLRYPITLAATKPVGVSNDVIFSESNSEFMETVISSLETFDHDYLTTYATVMFSTGPMFLSAMLSLWNRDMPLEQDRIRILPRSLYGKNIAVDKAPDAFFRHYYGSSWHGDDSAFILFLGKHGMLVFKIAVFAVLAGCLYVSVISWTNRKSQWHNTSSVLDGRYSRDSVDSERGLVEINGMDHEKSHWRSA